MHDWTVYLTLARLAIDAIRLVHELARAFREWLARLKARKG